MEKETMRKRQRINMAISNLLGRFESEAAGEHEKIWRRTYSEEVSEQLSMNNVTKQEIAEYLIEFGAAILKSEKGTE